MLLLNTAAGVRLERAMLDLHLFTLAGTPITVGTLIVFLVIVIVAYGFSRFLQRALSRAMTKRKVHDEGAIAVSGRLLHYAVVLLGLAIGLHTMGINLTGLFAAGALFAVGVGFALQSLTQNFVSGVILLVERSVTPGDIVNVDGQVVRVKDLGIRATLVRSLNDEDLIVPNSLLIQSTLINYTLQDKIIRVRTSVGVAYTSDLDQVFETLERAALGVDVRSQVRDPSIQLKEFADSSVVFEVSIWIDDPWELQPRRSALNRAIWNALKADGITIAYPQMDLHLDEPVSRALAAIK